MLYQLRAKLFFLCDLYINLIDEDEAPFINRIHLIQLQDFVFTFASACLIHTEECINVLDKAESRIKKIPDGYIRMELFSDDSICKIKDDLE